jgi:hypothetical protein
MDNNSDKKNSSNINDENNSRYSKKNIKAVGQEQ